MSCKITFLRKSFVAKCAKKWCFTVVDLSKKEL